MAISRKQLTTEDLDESKNEAVFSLKNSNWSIINDPNKTKAGGYQADALLKDINRGVSIGNILINETKEYNNLLKNCELEKRNPSTEELKETIKNAMIRIYFTDRSLEKPADFDDQFNTFYDSYCQPIGGTSYAIASSSALKGLGGEDSYLKKHQSVSIDYEKGNFCIKGKIFDLEYQRMKEGDEKSIPIPGGITSHFEMLKNTKEKGFKLAFLEIDSPLLIDICMKKIVNIGQWEKDINKSMQEIGEERITNEKKLEQAAKANIIYIKELEKKIHENLDKENPKLAKFISSTQMYVKDMHPKEEAKQNENDMFEYVDGLELLAEVDSMKKLDPAIAKQKKSLSEPTKDFLVKYRLANKALSILNSDDVSGAKLEAFDILKKEFSLRKQDPVTAKFLKAVSPQTSSPFAKLWRSAPTPRKTSFENKEPLDKTENKKSMK